MTISSSNIETLNSANFIFSANGAPCGTLQSLKVKKELFGIDGNLTLYTISMHRLKTMPVFKLRKKYNIKIEYETEIGNVSYRNELFAEQCLITEVEEEFGMEMFINEKIKMRTFDLYIKTDILQK